MVDGVDQSKIEDYFDLLDVGLVLFGMRSAVLCTVVQKTSHVA